MPFHITSVCVDAAPRVKSEVAWPELPVRLTVRPGTSRRTSATSRASCWSISLFVTTVTAAGVDSTLSGNAEAVTTIWSLTGVTGVTWAFARNRRTANRFRATSLRSCELKSPMQPVSWLPCPPRRAPFPLQQWAYDARLVDGYSGGGRAGISPASRSLQRGQVVKNGGGLIGCRVARLPGGLGNPATRPL